jgi:hypothetical protein
MENMKKLVSVTLLFLCPFVYAQAQEALHVQKVDGTVLSSSLVSIQRIIFEEDVMVITASEGEYRLPLDNVEKITFSDSSSAIENVITNSIQISKSGYQLIIESDNAMEQLYLVDVSGKVIVSDRLASVNTTSITLPNSGVFVLFLKTSKGYIARKVIHS